MTNERLYGVAEVAKLCGPGIRSRDVSDGFTAGKLDPERAPLVSGRRAIPESYVPEIKRVMEELKRRRAGKAELQMA